LNNWYADCRDDLPWWRITGQAYRKYFAVQPGGGVEALEDAVRADLIRLGSKEIGRRLGVTPRAVTACARRLGYRHVGPRAGGKWIAPEVRV